MNQKDKAFISADILRNKSYAEPSVFQPRNLLRESRRQNGIPLGKVPSICILDPDGNLLDYLKNENRALLNKFWALKNCIYLITNSIVINDYVNSI